MKIDVGDGILYSIIWVVIGACVLGPVYMYHQHKGPRVYYHIPAELKQEADNMWRKIYAEMEAEGYTRADQAATEAVRATYGVPFITQDNKLEQTETYEPPVPATDNKSSDNYNDF